MWGGGRGGAPGVSVPLSPSPDLVIGFTTSALKTIYRDRELILNFVLSVKAGQGKMDILLLVYSHKM